MKFAWKYDEVEPKAQRIGELLVEAGVKYEFVGSFRRHCAIVRDLDIMVESIENLKEILNPVNPRWFRRDLTLPCVLPNNLSVKFYEVIPYEWGAGLLAYTGNTTFVMKIRERAKKLGMTLKPSGLYDAGGLVTCQTEPQIFHVLGMEYIPPEEREIIDSPKSRARKSE